MKSVSLSSFSMTYIPIKPLRVNRSLRTLTYGHLRVMCISMLLAACVYAVEPLEEMRSVAIEKNQVHQKLKTLQKNISTNESLKQQTEAALAASQANISRTNHALNTLLEQQAEAVRKLKALEEAAKQLENDIAKQKQQLAKLLKEQYETGETSRIKLLLSGDNPNRMHRELRYLGYISTAQHQLVVSLEENLVIIEQKKEAIKRVQEELARIAANQIEQKQSLEKERTKRSDLLKNLADKLAQQRQEAQQLKKNEGQLAQLVKKLNQQIKAQTRKKKTQQQASQASIAESKTMVRPDQTTSPLQPLEGGAFAQLKGKLPLPIAGVLLGQYGAKRGEGSVWKGLFIGANEGGSVKSIAIGRVVFANWMRGFGQLMIIDHEEGYMSIYGNNQSLLKQVNDVVKPGETIAIVGNSGQYEQSGLYFELRFQGKPMNPLLWTMR